MPGYTKDAVMECWTVKKAGAFVVQKGRVISFSDRDSAQGWADTFGGTPTRSRITIKEINDRRTPTVTADKGAG